MLTSICRRGSLCRVSTIGLLCWRIECRGRWVYRVLCRWCWLGRSGWLSNRGHIIARLAIRRRLLLVLWWRDVPADNLTVIVGVTGYHCHIAVGLYSIWLGSVYRARLLFVDHDTDYDDDDNGDE